MQSMTLMRLVWNLCIDMKKQLLVWAFPILFFACNSVQNNENRIISSVNQLSVYIGCNIDSLPDIDHYTKHKVMEQGDEDIALRWASMDYYDNGTLILSMEANWVHPNIVSRITIWSDELKTDSVYVGQQIGVIRNLVDSEIPTSPDGELFVNMKGNPKLSLQVDIGENPKLFRGVTYLEQIPDSLRILSIIIK